MSPDKRYKAKAKRKQAPKPAVPPRPSSDDAHDIVYFKREARHDPAETMPGREFLARCPASVRITMLAVLVNVAQAPPKRFCGGGYWEAMSGDMKGYHEVRVDGPGRRHYRLFCLLDYDAVGATKPLLVVIAGMDKPFRSTFTSAQYASVRELEDEYVSDPHRSTG